MIRKTLLCAPLLLWPALTFSAVPDDCVTRADGDGDGVVGSSDYSILLGKWGQTGNYGPTYADFDWDGTTGSADYSILLAEWGKVACALARRSTIAGLTRTGDADHGWNHVQRWADLSFTSDLFCNQDSDDDMIAFAKAIVWAVLDTHGGTTEVGGKSASTLRSEVEAELDQITNPSEWDSTGPQCHINGGDELGTARNLGGYVQAALILNYRDADFRTWVHDMLFVEAVGGAVNTLEDTVRGRPNNFGAWGMASALAASAYLVRYDFIEDVVSIFKRHLGDRSQPLGDLVYGDDSWQPDSYKTSPVSIVPDAYFGDYNVTNEAGCGHPGGPSSFGVIGLFPEERRRDCTGTYYVPYTPDVHETGYFSAMIWASVVLMSLTNGSVPWGMMLVMGDGFPFDPLTFPMELSWDDTSFNGKGSLDLAYGYMGTTHWSTSEGSNSILKLRQNDRPTACIVDTLGYSLGWGQVASQKRCCLDLDNDAGSVDGEVSRGFAFTGFLFGGHTAINHENVCDPDDF